MNKPIPAPSLLAVCNAMQSRQAKGKG